MEAQGEGNHLPPQAYCLQPSHVIGNLLPPLPVLDPGLLNKAPGVPVQVAAFFKVEPPAAGGVAEPAEHGFLRAGGKRQLARNHFLPRFFFSESAGADSVAGSLAGTGEAAGCSLGVSIITSRTSTPAAAASVFTKAASRIFCRMAVW